MGYNSKYKSSEIEGILDSVGGKQDAISDLEAIRDGASKGATSAQLYITTFDVLSLYDLAQNPIEVGGIQSNNQAITDALAANKIVLVPYAIDDESVRGHALLVGYAEDLLYFKVITDSYEIYVETSRDAEEIIGQEVTYRDWYSKQDALKSGENIKTINGESILGRGDIEISGGKKIVPNKQEAVSFAFTYDSENGPLEPNKIYICHNTEILDVIILDIIPPEDLYGEYTCLFKFGGASVDSLVLMLPDYVLWANGTAPQLEVKTSYELSITATKFIDSYIYKAILTPFKPVE